MEYGYDDKDYTLDSFDGIKVSVRGHLGDEYWQLAEVYVKDGCGIERLLKLVDAERDEWDSFSFGVQTVASVDDVVLDRLDDRRASALVRVFDDEFCYRCIDEETRRHRLEGIALVTGDWTHIGWQYAKLVSQVDETLLPEEDREFAKSHPPIISDFQAECLRKAVERRDEK